MSRMDLSSPPFLRTRGVARQATAVRGPASPCSHRRWLLTDKAATRGRSGSPARCVAWGRPAGHSGAAALGAQGAGTCRAGCSRRACARGPRAAVAPLPRRRPSARLRHQLWPLKQRRVSRRRSALPAGALWRTPAGRACAALPHPPLGGHGLELKV